MTEAVESEAGDVEIGARLRRLRRERQLSQADLGGERFSGSYVSHLEKGRRRVSAEMVEFFARRLGVTAESITTDQRPVDLRDEGDRATAFQQVQRALAQRQFAWAARSAEGAVRSADERGDVADAWSLALMRVQALYEDDQYPQAVAEAIALAQQPLARQLPRLAVEALVLAGRAARAASDLTSALELAERAVEVVGQVEDVDLQAEARVVLIGALMESDRSERAVDHCVELVAMIERIRSEHIRGLAQWTAGNVAFLTGDAELGTAHHAEAARLLSPQVDLRIWGRFRKAAATVRMREGSTEGVQELLSQAGDALRIVGNPSDLTELRLAEARLRLLTGDLEQAAAMVRFCLEDATLQGAAHSRAEAEALLGDVERVGGRIDAAAAAYRRSALQYERAGAYRRSIEMWRRQADLGSDVNNIDADESDVV